MIRQAKNLMETAGKPLGTSQLIRTSGSVERALSPGACVISRSRSKARPYLAHAHAVEGLIPEVQLGVQTL